MTIGIYRITCLINGKVYIGKSMRCENRLQNHRYGMSRPEYRGATSRDMHADVVKYGIACFRFDIIRTIDPSDYETLSQVEIDEMIRHQSYLPDRGYNKSLSHSKSNPPPLHMITKSSRPDGVKSNIPHVHVRKLGNGQIMVSQTHLNHEFVIDQHDMGGELVKRWFSTREILTANPGYVRQGIYGVANTSRTYKGFRWKKTPMSEIYS